MDSSFDMSFDASALLEDHQLITTELLLGEDTCGHSPAKKHVSKTQTFCPSLAEMARPELPCLFLLLLPSGELFQMTHHLRQEQSLHNNKIRKLILDLQGDAADYALDDQLRTRVFRARVSRESGPSPLASRLDPLDLQLDSYLRDTELAPRLGPARGSPTKHRGLGADENKENAPEPSKRKLSDAPRKPPPKRMRPRALVPALQPTRSDANLASAGGLLRGLQNTPLSPQRVCVPRAASLPGRSSLKSRKDTRIFLVDSLTGSVADATQFGTELNASNCEGFPLPDNAHEVVQIPTNDTVPAAAAQKMAIIRALVGKCLEPAPDRAAGYGAREKGFYSKREYDAQRRAVPEVAIYSDAEKRVRWADELEW